MTKTQPISSVLSETVEKVGARRRRFLQRLLAIGCATVACLFPVRDAPSAGPRKMRIPEPRPSSQWSPEEKAIRRCLDYWTRISTRRWYPEYGWAAGWAFRYTLDLGLRQGEAGQPIPPDVICLKNPGTAMMGHAYLLAYRVLGEPRYLEAATEVGQLLLAAQTQAGGWGKELWMGRKEVNSIRTYPGIKQWPSSDPPDKVRGGDTADLEGATTADAMEFLYKLWWVTRDDRFLNAWRKALDFHLVVQESTGGGFPESYPAGGYRARASFFGQTTSASVKTLQLGYERTGDPKYLDAIVRCADWMVSVRKPGQGWGMRYDRDGNVVGGRSFEPAALCTESTLYAIYTLGVAYEYRGKAQYMDAIKDAAAWLRELPASQGVCAMFYQPGTNRPWFVDGTGKKVRGPRKARRDYTWVGPWCSQGIDMANRLAVAARNLKHRRVPPGGRPQANAWVPLLERPKNGEQKALSVEEILASQTSNGTWPVKIGSLDMLGVWGTSQRVHRLCIEVAGQRFAEAKAKEQQSGE